MAKLSSEDHEYRLTENSVSSINYHFVFVPKRRKSVLVSTEVDSRFSGLFSHLQMTFAISKELEFLAGQGFRVNLTLLGIAVPLQ